jgi:hypothetical protein
LIPINNAANSQPGFIGNEQTRRVSAAAPMN